MPRYIDVDKAITAINDEMFMNESTKSLFLMILRAIPTADVVPRAEVEELSYKLECLLCYSTGGKLSKASYSLKTMECAVTDYINDCCYETDTETKAEAIKEFAERLHKYIDNFREKREMVMLPYTEAALLCVEKNIDNLVKEMTD